MNELAIMGSIAMIYGIVQRSALARRWRHVVLGLAFGAGATLSMMQPVQLMDGVIVDGRTLFIGFAGAFLSPVGAMVALGFGFVARIVIGGGGMWIGLLSMAIAGGMGMLWVQAGRWIRVRGAVEMLLLAAMISVSLLASLLLPEEVRWFSLSQMMPVLFLLNVVGALFLGALLQRERAASRLYREMRQEAETDPLTGLLNRRAFERRFDQARAGVRQAGTALLIVDLDHFKKVNDTFGHAVGDEVLRKAARVMHGSVRATDVVSRMGGEEFAILLPDTSVEEAVAIGQRLRERLYWSLNLGGAVPLRVTASIGAAHDRLHADTVHEMMRDADRALYRAKENGRNRLEGPDIRSAA